MSKIDLDKQIRNIEATLKIEGLALSEEAKRNIKQCYYHEMTEQKIVDDMIAKYDERPKFYE